MRSKQCNRSPLTAIRPPNAESVAYLSHNLARCHIQTVKRPRRPESVKLVLCAQELFDSLLGNIRLGVVEQLSTVLKTVVNHIKI
jgi:hypothetical protein